MILWADSLSLNRVCSFCPQDIQIEALLMRACEPVIQTHCHVSLRNVLSHCLFLFFWNKLVEKFLNFWLNCIRRRDVLLWFQKEKQTGFQSKNTSKKKTDDVTWTDEVLILCVQIKTETSQQEVCDLKSRCFSDCLVKTFSNCFRRLDSLIFLILLGPYIFCLQHTHCTYMLKSEKQRQGFSLSQFCCSFQCWLYYW